MRITLSLFFLLIILFSCNNGKVKSVLNPKVVVNTVEEKKMPYLDIDEGRLKTTNLRIDSINAQIAFSAYKRAVKFVYQDSIDLKIHYLIKSGEEINISPILQELIEAIVYAGNKNIEKILEKNPQLLNSKTHLINGKRVQQNLSNEFIPSWAEAYKMIEDYRKIKNK